MRRFWGASVMERRYCWQHLELRKRSPLMHRPLPLCPVLRYHATESIPASNSDTQSGTPDTPEPSYSKSTVAKLPQDLLRDQLGMWTSPAKIRFSDATWMVPLGGFAAALFATDSDISRHLSNDPGTLTHYRHISDYGAYSMAGGAGGLYFLGLLTHNEHQRETGFLSGESAIDALVAVEALKFATGRQRPYQGDGTGQFLKGGASFPSEHSAAVWAIAGTVAHEYPSPFMKLALLRDGNRGQRVANHCESNTFLPTF